MKKIKRRDFIAGSVGASLISTTTPAISASRGRIDARVAKAMEDMRSRFYWARDLEEAAAAILIIPRLTKAGFGFGGGYGEGALLIKGATVDYYSVAALSTGLQIGVSTYTSALFIMETRALRRFRARDGWTIGADLDFTAITEGESISLDNNTARPDIYGIAFGHKGLMIAATIEGSKYSRIYR